MPRPRTLWIDLNSLVKSLDCIIIHTQLVQGNSHVVPSPSPFWTYLDCLAKELQGIIILLR